MNRVIRILRLFAFSAGVLACVAAFASFSSPSYAAGTAILQCTIVDAASDAVIPARCRLIDMNGSNRFPPAGTSFYHPARGGYFYTGGSFSCTVPVGSVAVTVKRGFAYREAAESVNVRSDTSIVIELERIVSMDSLGWYSGDTHVHIDHAGGAYVLDPEDAFFMANAEGLNVVNCLDNDYYFTGASASCSTPECIVFMSEEMRSSCYGHLGLLGLSSLVSPVSSIWWPMTMDIADSAHTREGSLVVSAHPVSSDVFTQVESWPGNGIARELPVDCLIDRIDAVDVLSYSNCHNGGIEIDLWYRLLNCGFRLPASAGTDAAMNRLDSYPLGGFRVYARVAGDVLSAESWFEALAGGRTFVTNGPLITRFEVGGHTSGDSIGFAQPGAVVPVEISVKSVHPINRIEIVRNGAPAVTMLFEPPRSSVDTSVSVALYESSWVATGVYGTKRGWIPAGDFLFAHTSPVYITVGGRPILERGDAEFFVQWIEDLELLAASKGQWADTAQALRVFRDLAAARAWYEERAVGGVTDALGAHPRTPSALRCENVPNPFGNGTVIGFDIPVSPGRSTAGDEREESESRVTLAIYDASGRLVRRLVEAPLPAGRYRIAWDGRDERGRNAASGIYFARISAGRGAFTRKLVLVR